MSIKLSFCLCLCLSLSYRDIFLAFVKYLYRGWRSHEPGTVSERSPDAQFPVMWHQERLLGWQLRVLWHTSDATSAYVWMQQRRGPRAVHVGVWPSPWLRLRRGRAILCVPDLSWVDVWKPSGEMTWKATILAILLLLWPPYRAIAMMIISLSRQLGNKFDLWIQYALL